MPQYNLQFNQPLEQIYKNGYLPQRNSPTFFYQESSCRSDLVNFKLSSENRRILRKTTSFTFTKVSLSDFNYTSEIQKQIKQWLRQLNWNFPINSVKTVFKQHLFNYVYVWQLNQRIVAYSICYFSKSIAHIAYVFYDPEFSHSDLPIRLVLQVVIDSQQCGLKYCYLGRFSHYKRNMPGFENFENNSWLKS